MWRTDGGGNPQHFQVKAAEVQGRGARERVPASKFSPSVEKKKSSRTHTSNSEDNNSASDSDSEEAADAAKSLIRLNSSCSTTEANILSVLSTQVMLNPVYAKAV